MPVGQKQICRFGPFEFDPECGQIRKDGVGLKIQGQPLQILDILLDKPGQLVTREELRQRLWTSDTFVDFDHSLNSAIKKLRQALGDEADTPTYIETLPRRGYRFVGKLSNPPHRSDRPVTAPQDDIVRNAVAILADAALKANNDLKRRRRFAAWIFAILAALLLFTIALRWLTKARPLPRIVASHALTKTKFRKVWGQNRVLTDGVNLYFQERELSSVKAVRLVGGETSELQIPWKDNAALRDVTQDGSQLLFSVFNTESKEFDAWIQPLPVGSPRLIVKDARFPVFTPDDRRILFVRNLDRNLYRVNVDGTQEQQLNTFPDVSGLAISPDGLRIRASVAHTGTIWESGTDGLNPHQIFTEHGESVAQGDWSVSGAYYFFQSWDGERFNLWVSSEKPSWFHRAPQFRQLTFGPLGYGTPAVARDGRHLYAVGVEPHGELSIYDPHAGRYIPYLNGLSACFVDFSRDGKWITYVSYPEGTLWRSRVDGSERTQLTVAPLGVANPRWSPDGRRIVFMDLSAGNRQLLRYKSRIYVVSAEGGGPSLLVDGDRTVNDPTWSPDGSSIAYGTSGPAGPEDREIRLLDISSATSTKIPGSEGLWSPRWSPDGKYLWSRKGLYPMKVFLFSFLAQQWKELPVSSLEWPTWSLDSKFVYGMQAGDVVRVAIPGGEVQKIAPLPDFPTTAFFFDRWGQGWFGLTPDGRPLTTRDTGIEEVYAFDLEFN